MEGTREERQSSSQDPRGYYGRVGIVSRRRLHHVRVVQQVESYYCISPHGSGICVARDNHNPSSTKDVRSCAEHNLLQLNSA